MNLNEILCRVKPFPFPFDGGGIKFTREDLELLVRVVLEDERNIWVEAIKARGKQFEAERDRDYAVVYQD